ncbi:aldose 1-epimerase family protein [Radiobacillus sp. PE A8.2]|uniref:aldose 1-epimerase family protein n=1 Tax=Radiobacillus sp. PE A8.2 TaxID=3380349 RepID=UPI0038900CAC
MNVLGLNSKLDIHEKLGDLRQIASIECMEVMEASGIKNQIIQVRNGIGLRFEINVSRGFDIGLCELHGIPISWVSSTGRVAPFFYEKEGNEWNRGFEGGLLTTCGLQQAGKPSVDEEQSFGQHGRVSWIPATVLQTEVKWENDTYIMICKGKVVESKAGGEKLVLERSIITYVDKNRIEVSDRVVNEQFHDQPHMILYHWNFGYPLIDENTVISELKSDKQLINGNDSHYLETMGMPKVSQDAKPSLILHENIYTHDDNIRINMKNNIRLLNELKTLEVEISYDKNQCPYLSHWRNSKKGMNVMSFEPGNVSTKGRKFHRENGSLPTLSFGEERTYDFTIEFKID